LAPKGANLGLGLGQIRNFQTRARLSSCGVLWAEQLCGAAFAEGKSFTSANANYFFIQNLQFLNKL
jgi:hypothetical protein